MSMKKIIACIIVIVYACGAVFADCTAAETEYSFNLSVDEYTTTHIRPWLVNWHITEPRQAANDYLGGETGQRCKAGAVCSANSEIVLIGGDTWGISRSDDGGVTWNPSGIGIEPQGISAIAFYPESDSIAFALATNCKEKVLAETGIYKSTNAGRTWRQVLKSFNNSYSESDRVIAFSDTNSAAKIYVASQTGDGIVMSSDLGETWGGIGLEGRKINTLKYCNGKLIAASTNYGIEVSADEGRTWEAMNAGFETKTVDDGAEICNVRSFDINPAGNGYWYAINYGNIYESRDSGLSWSKVYTWKSSSMGTAENLVFTNPNADGKNLMLIGRGGIGGSLVYSEDLGRSFKSPNTASELSFWDNVSGYSKPNIYLHPNDPNIFFATMGDEICRSSDGGYSLEASSSGHSGLRITDMWFNPNDDNDIAMSFTDYGIARTVDTGAENVKYPLATHENVPSNLRYDGQQSSYTIVLDPKNENRWLASFGSWGVSILMESMDGGFTWTQLGDFTLAARTRVRFNLHNPNTIYAGEYISYDDGATWMKSAYSVSTTWTADMNVVYHVDSTGIFKSVDEGKNWETLISKTLYDTRYVTADYSVQDKLYIGRWSNGFYIFENGKLRSVGNGDSSGLVGNSYNFTGFYEIAQDPKNPRHLVTGGNDCSNFARSSGIFESYDGGETWSRVDGSCDIVCDTWSVIFHPNLPRVYIGTSNGCIVYEYDKVYDMTDKIYLDYNMKHTSELFDIGIPTAYTDGYLRPEKQTTRGEFAIYIKKLMGIKSLSTEQKFTDVPVSSRFFTAVTACAEQGIVKDEGEVFKPDEGLTNADAAVYIYNALTYLKGADLSDWETNAERYSDIADERVRLAVCVLCENNIANRDIVNKLDEICVRADILSMLYGVKLCIDDNSQQYCEQVFDSSHTEGGAEWRFVGNMGVKADGGFYPTDSSGNGAVIVNFKSLGSYTLELDGKRGYNAHTHFFENQSADKLAMRYSVVITGSGDTGKVYLLKTSNAYPAFNIANMSAEEILAETAWSGGNGDYKVRIEYDQGGFIGISISYNGGEYVRVLEYEDEAPLTYGTCGMQFQGNGGSVFRSAVMRRDECIPMALSLGADGNLSGRVSVNKRFSKFRFLLAGYNDNTLVKVSEPEVRNRKFSVENADGVYTAMYCWDLERLYPMCPRINLDEGI